MSDMKHLWLASLCAVILVISAPGRAFLQSAEQGGKTREITSNDFAKARPAQSAGQSAGKNPPVAPRRRRIYRLAKTESAPARKRRNNNALRPNAAAGPARVNRTKPGRVDLVQQLIGITLWRLRPSTAEDDGPFIRVAGASGKPEMWTPVRVGADHRFVLGDLVRLTVESPRSGYLYVIDRELHADGSLGDPMLIFPTKRTRDGDNRVEAGRLIDIPSWADRTPFFLLKAQHPKYSGELLTFIVSPEPLSDLTIGQGPLSLDRSRVERWEDEWGTDADLYEMEGGVGETQTKAEQEASRPRTRQLTQEEPVPQTIYRLTLREGSPLLVNVAVRVSRPNN